MKDEAMRQGKLSFLQERLVELAGEGSSSLALGYSGGLDSRFLAHVCRRAGVEPLLLHAVGPHISADETAFARAWALRHGFALREVSFHPLHVPEVAENGRRRCYYCKRELFSRIRQAAEHAPLCDGTHASDAKGYRPGIAALRELGILSPLADAGLDKEDIHALAAATGMDLPGQHPRPCLLTRFAYLLPPSEEVLRLLDTAERAVEQALQAWHKTEGDETPEQTLQVDFRIRCLGLDKMELHVAFEPGDGVERGLLPAAPEPLLAALEAAARGAGAPLTAVRVLERLSGFFDSAG